MILAQDSSAQTAQVVDRALTGAETAASAPSWSLAILVLLAVIFAARPRKDDLDGPGR